MALALLTLAPPAAAQYARAVPLANRKPPADAEVPADDAQAAAAHELTAAERRGKEIYVSGTSPSGESLTALMGEARIEVPATALPCAGCHGRDGRGRPEGGVEPPALTWAALTRPYEVTTLAGRQRGPYDDRLLVRAVTLGVDSAGNELDPVMPRYRLSRQDAEDLVAYLHKLGDDRDPGITDDALTVGVLLPPAGVPALAAGATAQRRTVEAAVEHLNGGGGMYARQLKVRYLELPADPAARPAAVSEFLDAEPTFALIASFTAGSDRELAGLAAERKIPLLGPLTLYPEESFPLNRQVFYLDGGLPGQVGALVRVAARLRGNGEVDGVNGGSKDGGGDGLESTEDAGAAGDSGAAGDPEGAVAPPALAVLAPAEGLLADLADELLEQAEEANLPEPDRLTLTAGFDAEAATRAVEAWSAAGVTDLFLLAPGDEEAAVLRAAAAAGWAPRIYAPGSLADPSLLAPSHGFPGRLFLAFNSLPTDRGPAGLERFHQSVGETSPGATEVSTYLAFDLLLEGLRRAGRDLSREGLIESLEDLRDRPTGLMRPMSYGPNRRIGVRGAYVVAVGPEGPQGSEWVDEGWGG